MQLIITNAFFFLQLTELTRLFIRQPSRQLLASKVSGELRLTKKLANQEREKGEVKGVKTCFYVYEYKYIYIYPHERETFPLSLPFAFPG